MTNNLVNLLHHDGYFLNTVTDEGDLVFEISGPDTMLRTGCLYNACQLWLQITKKSDKDVQPAS